MLCKQLEELLKSDVVGGTGDDDDGERDGDCDGDGGGAGGESGEGLMVPEMPERLGWSRDVEEDGNGGAGVTQQPQTASFTSLLWNAANPSTSSGGQSTQVQLQLQLLSLWSCA